MATRKTGEERRRRAALTDHLGCDPEAVPFTEAQAAVVAEVLDEVRARRARRRTPCATPEAA